MIKAGDTYYALASPVGRSAISTIRISGPKSLTTLLNMSKHKTEYFIHRKSSVVDIYNENNGLIDNCVVVWYCAPNSFTGEDLVEIHTHGNPKITQNIYKELERLGLRLAEPGEFTRTAYLNKKLDLIQAEAVLDLVEGRSRALHGSAVFQLERGLSLRIAEARAEMIELEAHLVHHIDFPEEDEAPVSIEKVLAVASGLRNRLEQLLATAPEGELLREGALTVLAGPPNSGKSSLYNALLGEERAIVTEMPGTTRDALEVTVSLGGFPFRLVDTAGMREADDLVERLGIEVARRYLDRADLVLLCVEAGERLEAGERAFLKELAGTPVVLLRTKSDLAPQGHHPAPDYVECDAKTLGAREALDISVADGTGLGELAKLLPSLVYGGLVRTGVSVPVLTRRRQTEAIRSASDHLTTFMEELDSGVPAEMAATHLRPAETALEELLGVISTDQILERIFRNFCIGK